MSGHTMYIPPLSQIVPPEYIEKILKLTKQAVEIFSKWISPYGEKFLSIMQSIIWTAALTASVQFLATRIELKLSLLKWLSKGLWYLGLDASSDFDFVSPTSIKKKLSDLILNEDINIRVTRFVKLFKDSDLAATGDPLKLRYKLAKGILLSGPPGVGKSHLAEALSKELGWSFCGLSSATISNEYIHSGPQRLKIMFNRAKHLAPAVIFLDEADSIIMQRQTNEGNQSQVFSQSYNDTVNAFLKEIDDLEGNRVLVIAATNFEGALDSAATRVGRFSEQWCLKLPSSKEKKALFEKLLKEQPIGSPKTVKTDAHADLSSPVAYSHYFALCRLASHCADTTADISGVTIKEIVNRAAQGACIENRQYIVQGDLDKAIIDLKVEKKEKNYRDNGILSRPF
jgi:hypothetical protein